MHTQTKFEVIPDLLTEGFEDLDDNDFNHKFDTEFRSLKKEHIQYSLHVRDSQLARIVGKDMCRYMIFYIV